MEANGPAGRAVQVVARHQDGKNKLGSGYLVTADLVITAQHVVGDADRVSVQFVDAPGQVRKELGRTEWANKDVDVALVRLDAAVPDTDLIKPVRYGRLVGEVNCEAVGYPWFKLRDGGGGVDAASPSKYRESSHIRATCNPFNNIISGMLQLAVGSPPPPHPDGPERSPWEGMSGAAVFVDGVLIGLVTDNFWREGPGLLTARPVKQWYTLPADDLAALRALIAIPEADQMVAVGELIVATVEREPLTLTVDAAPPREITRAGVVHSILLATRAPVVTLWAMRAVVVARRSPRRACLESPRLGAFLEPRPFTADFDTDPPKLTALEKNFPFTIKEDEVELFTIEPRVSTHEVSWHLEIDWIYIGQRGTTVVDDGGKPFEIYPTRVLWGPKGPSALNWGCSDFGGGHVPGCPTERLVAMRRTGSAEALETDSTRTELEAEFPDWVIWRSDAGHWYATPRSPGVRGVVAADSPNGLRLQLRKRQREGGPT